MIAARNMLVKMISVSLLTGCTAEPIREVIEVKVPVTVPCRTPAPIDPGYPADALPVDSRLDVALIAFLKEREQRRKYSAEFEASVSGCN